MFTPRSAGSVFHKVSEGFTSPVPVASQLSTPLSTSHEVHFDLQNPCMIAFAPVMPRPTLLLIGTCLIAVEGMGKVPPKRVVVRLASDLRNSSTHLMWNDRQHIGILQHE